MGEKLPENNENRKLEQELAASEEGKDAIESWRILRIMSEFVEGFDFLRRFDLAATFYGSARSELGDKLYDNASELAGLLAQSGFAVITGGSAGIMEAANRGAYEAGGQSVGINIRLPKEQLINRYVTAFKNFNFFFTRKVMLAYAAEVYIFFPGGYGTLDEFFEMITLIQTRKISKIPVVLYGRDYWEPLVKYMDEKLYRAYHSIDADDRDIYKVVDSVEEAYWHIIDSVCSPQYEAGNRLSGHPANVCKPIPTIPRRN